MFKTLMPMLQQILDVEQPAGQTPEHHNAQVRDALPAHNPSIGSSEFELVWSWHQHQQWRWQRDQSSWQLGTQRGGLGDAGASGQQPVAAGKEGQHVNTVPEMESSK